MRIREVRVVGLFDLFDHTITLNQTDRVTIVHGPNGYGKTAVLRLLRALFDCDYAHLERTPFQAIELEFDDGRTLHVHDAHPPTETGGEPAFRLEFRLSGGADEVREWDAPAAPQKLTPYINPYARRTLQAPLDGPLVRRDWRTELGLDSKLRVRLVDTQRLHHKGLSAIKSIAKELAATIADQQAAYGRRAQELDRTFPARLLQRESGAVLSVGELRHNLDSLERKTQRLVEAGLLDRQKGVSAPVDRIDEEGREILSIFVTDAASKLAVFDDLLARLELLRDVIRRRFSFKTLITDGESGISFVSVRGVPLDLDDLSSGEQHELILLYELLFRVAPGTLVLIDEPELSLHILWQSEFVDDLASIVKLRDFDVLLATHSPDIIGKHWDLTVELKPPPGLNPHA